MQDPSDQRIKFLTYKILQEINLLLQLSPTAKSHTHSRRYCDTQNDVALLCRRTAE